MRSLFAILIAVFLAALPANAQNAFEAFRAGAAQMDETYIAGDYAAAEEIGQAALALGRAELGENAQDVLWLQTRLANVIEDRGRRTEALKLARDAWERWTAHYPQYNPYRQRAQMAYARMLAEMGAPEEALPLALEPLRFAELAFGPDASITVVWRWNVAGIYERLGYQEEALEVFKQVLVYYREATVEDAPRKAASAAQIIAQTYSKMDRDEEADPFWTEAMARTTEVYPESHPDRANTELLYAWHAYAMKRYDALGGFLETLRPRLEQAFGAQSPQAFSLRELKALMTATQAEVRGNDEVRQAADQLREVALGLEDLLGPTSERSGHVWLNLSPMLTELGDHAGALDAVLKAEKAGLGSRGTLYLALDNAVEAGAITRRDAVVEVFRISQVGYSNSFKTAAKIRGARLELRGGKAEAAYRELTDRKTGEETLQAQLLKLASLPATERDGGSEEALRAALKDNSARIDELIDFISENEPAGAAMIGDAVISLDEVQRLLLPHEALVVMDFPRFSDAQADIIAVTKNDAGWWLAGADQENMRAAASDLRASIDLRFGLRAAAPLAPVEQEKGNGFNYFAANFLYRNTFGVAEDLLAGKTHIYVELRGALSGVPPQLLVKELPGEGAPEREVHWMVRDHAITVIPSPFALKVSELASATGRVRKPLMGFADPDFAGVTGVSGGEIKVAGLGSGPGALRGALIPLPETRAEVEAVAEALGGDGATVFEGKAASEAAVKAAALDEYEVLYFATHGLVAGDVVQGGTVAEPALALSAGGGEDGLLTSSEVAALHLDADLVVLSACNTAVGGEPGAEALSGLAQAFAYAGAGSLMVSHWPVESRSAVAMMTDIFRRRAADPDLGLAEAQRQAILTLLDAPANPDWSHPAYWAPFVLVGNAD